MTRLGRGLAAAVVATALALPAAPAGAHHTSMVHPVTGTVISDFGDSRPNNTYCGSGNHCGYDIAVNSDNAIGGEIRAAYGGRVVRADTRRRCGSNAGFGIYLEIDHGAGWTTLYSHLDSVAVAVNSTVTKGQLIGREGVTGNASNSSCVATTQPHLHLEIRRNGVPQDLSFNGRSQTCLSSSAICVGQRVVAGNAIPFHFDGLAGTGPVSPSYVGITRRSSGGGYWVVGVDGGVFSFGDAPFYGSLPGIGVSTNRVVGIQSTPSGGGYWVLQNDGGVFAFGDAPFKGALPGSITTDRIRAMATTPSGQGYWLVQDDGGVFAFGDAGFYGSLPGLGIRPSQPIVDIAAATNGRGYVLVGADGGVFAFGEAAYTGSLPGIGVARTNVTAVTADPDGRGYWIVTGNGEVYGFEAPYHGGANGLALAQPIQDMDSRPANDGYWMIGGDGGVFAFGAARFLGRP